MNEEEQAEIERRCKLRMYFGCQAILTKEQMSSEKHKNLEMFPFDPINTMLCTVCSIMTEEQMKNISAWHYNIKWTHRTLHDWYIQHCKDDAEFNEEKTTCIQ